MRCCANKTEDIKGVIDSDFLQKKWVDGRTRYCDNCFFLLMMAKKKKYKKEIRWGVITFFFKYIFRICSDGGERGVTAAL